MHFKRVFGLILSLILIFNICAYSMDVSTYDYMWENKTPILVRLGNEGLGNARINAFLNELDSQVSALEATEDTELLKQYFLVILFNVVLMEDDFADVCGAFDVAFQEELIYMAENDMALPPVMEEFFNIVMKKKIASMPSQEYYPTEEEPLSTPPDVQQPSQSQPEQPKEQVFSDVSEDFWAYPHILNLYEKGIVNGYKDKVFHPNNKITRAELAKIVCKAFLNENYKEALPYTDIQDGLWYKPYVETCAYYSIFSDIVGSEFCGKEYVTRQEMCTVIYRALLNSNIKLEEVQRYEFWDKESLAPYAVKAVEKLQYAGIVNGYGDYNFRPLNETTRSELCKVINMILEQQGR